MSDSESPTRVPDGQPDPVLVGSGLKALKTEAYSEATNATPSLNTDKQNPVTGDNASSYFANIPGTKAEGLDASDLPPNPEQTGDRENSGQDILRRLSLVGESSPVLPEVDPKTQHPGLKLSGRLISAAFCIPYKLHFKADSEWVCY